MVIDISKYRASNKEFFKKWLERYPEKKPLDLVGEMSAATFVPLIAVCHFVGELTSFTPELQAQIESLKKFYQIDKVEGTL